MPENNVFDIRDFGADCDKEDNAEYINKAIEIASKFGGTVLVSGGDYACTTVVLKSNVTLFIEYGSSISANTTGKGYERYRALLYAKDCENIALTGGGKLKGNGNYFGRKPLAERNNTTPARFLFALPTETEQARLPLSVLMPLSSAERKQTTVKSAKSFLTAEAE